MNFDDYKVTIPYPDRPRKPIMEKGQKSEVTGLRRHADALEKWERDMEVYRKAADAWRKADAEANGRFRQDVLREAGMEGHPKADKVYALAWEEGHSAGYSEIAIWVWKLAELVKD